MPTLPHKPVLEVKREAAILGAWVLGCVVLGALFAAWIGAVTPH